MVTVYSVLISSSCAAQGSKGKTGGSSSVTPHFMSQQPGFQRWWQTLLGLSITENNFTEKSARTSAPERNVILYCLYRAGEAAAFHGEDTEHLKS